MLILLALAAAAVQDQGTSLIDRDRIDRPRAPTPVPAPAPAKPQARIAATGSNTPIKGIRFEGAQAPGPVAQAAERFLGRPATVETLQELAGSLSRAYEKTDVALYTIAIPDQDFATGVVTVLLTEGSIATVQMRTDDPDSHPLARARLARLLDEKPLSRPTMERQFTLIQAQPGFSMKSDFTDPNGDGALTLTVTPQQKRSKFAFGYSNRGVDLLGDGQFDAKVSLYSLATDGDQLEIAGSAATDLKRYRLVSGSYSAPLTPSGLTLAASAAYLETRPENVPIRGDAKVAGVSLIYPLIRDFHRASDLSIGIDGIDSDNATLGNVVSSERTRALRAGASFSDTRERRAVSANLSVSKGLDILGARVTEPLADATFLKANAAFSLGQAIGKRGAIRLNARGQYTRDPLPAAELFSVGGETLGRAFDIGVLTADRGVGALAEAAWRPIGGDSFGTSEIYVFADKAWLGIESRGLPIRTRYSLASAGIGARARWKDKAELSLELAKPIDDPYPGYDSDWQVIIGWRLSLS